MKYILDLRFVKLLSYKASVWLFNNIKELSKNNILTNIKNRKYTYYYGLQIILGGVVKLSLLALTTLLLSIFINNICLSVMVVTLSFCSLRVWAGGMHFESYTKCTYFSIITLSLVGLSACYIPFNIIVNNIMFLIVLILFSIYSPVENVNHPIKNKIIIFKSISIISLSIIFFIGYYNDNVIVKQAIMEGVGISGIIVIPILSKIK